MDLLEVAYFMSRTKFSHEDYNRMNEIVKRSGREDLFKTSPKEKIEEIFRFLEENFKKEN